MLKILVKGGTIVAIESAAPEFIRRAVRIFDMDIESCDEADLTAVMIDGEVEDALVIDTEVGPDMTIGMAHLRRRVEQRSAMSRETLEGRGEMPLTVSPTLEFTSSDLNLPRESDTTLKILIKGATIVAIESAAPEFIGHAVRIFDLDIESCDEADLTAVMIDGAVEDALVIDTEVGPDMTVEIVSPSGPDTAATR